MHYRYCPQCGNLLVEKNIGDESNVPYCNQCERYYFDTFSSCCIIMVTNEYHEIALLTQSYLSNQYKSFVSGYIQPKETAEMCAMREVKEELGITLERLEYAGSYWFDERDQLMHGFIGYAKKKDFELSQEIQEAMWVSALEIVPLIFPDRPGNAMHPIYHQYLRNIGKE